MGILEGWIRTVTILIGSIGLGAVGLSGLVNVLSGILEPSAKWDPQGELNYILSLPIGALLGGTLASAILGQDKPRAKMGRIFVIIGGMTAILSLAIGFLSADTRGLSLQELFRTITSPWCLPPLIASSIVIASGIYLTNHQRKEKKTGTC